MNTVLLSGGSGKRLWPLSNEIRSKQFLRLIHSGNGRQSMLQRVYDQLDKAGLTENIIIATSDTQFDAIKTQLEGCQFSIVVEPDRRNTFPAIALACAHIFLNQKHSLDETVIVQPVDPFVEDSFFEYFTELDRAVQNAHADIILMGVRPTYPSEKYGYIIPDKTEGRINKVMAFKEKPSCQLAQDFINKGGLWNCGVFAFKLNYIITYLQSLIPFKTYDDVRCQYHKLNKISFDYEIVERADSVSVITYDGDWKDIGTWNTLTEVMEKQQIGKVVTDSNCINTHVINELEIPIVVMGASDMVISASPDGILVADKEQSSYIKDYVEHIDQRPMFEEREWGEYKVLDLSINLDGTKLLTKTKVIHAGADIPIQAHHHRAEIWTVLTGECTMTIDGRTHEAFAGDTYSIPCGMKHGIHAITDTKIIEIQIGKELVQDGTETDDSSNAD